MKTGTIFNIQRYAIHDGPGIRTTVFSKGCPLRCWWCHNPEGQYKCPEIIYESDKCILCQHCMDNCPDNAVQFIDDKRIWQNENCILCETCVNNCPVQALKIAGKKVNITEVINEIEKDVIFFDESGGGVTISGGEPFSQFAFIRELIPELKKQDINIAVDTCGYTEWEKIEELIDYIDLFLYDIKHMDSTKHREYTGVGNEIILENLTKLAAHHQNITIRFPLIPGINDDFKNIKKTGEFSKSLGIKRIDLLPYHNISQNKYDQLLKDYKMKDFDLLTEKQIQEIKLVLKKYGLEVKIGG